MVQRDRGEVWCVGACLVRRMHTVAAVLTRTRTLLCTSCSTRMTRREEATRKREEKAAEGSDDVGLRRQDMRKTLKPAGDAQQPWPAAPMHSDLNKRLRTI